jgi:hypothetical protein
MSNYPTGTAANVLVGPARLLVSPKGTTLPTLDGTVNPITWPAGWVEVGYTEAGTDMTYTPTIKDIMVDEEMAPVQKILDKEKATVTAVLAEATLANLNRAISASIMTQSAADVTHAQLATVEVGSGALNEVQIGFEGINPQTFQRIMIGYRAIAQATVKLTFKRADKTMMQVDFDLLADSTKTAGKRLFKILDVVAPHS